MAKKRQVFLTLGKKGKIVFPTYKYKIEVELDLDDKDSLNDEFLFYNNSTKELLLQIPASSLSEVRENIVEIELPSLNEDHQYTLVHEFNEEVLDKNIVFHKLTAKEIEELFESPL